MELAKSKLKGKASPKAPDLGKLYAWEKPSPKPKKKGVAQERPLSPSQKKHFSDTHLKSQVKQSDQGIAGPQPPRKESVQSLKTSRSLIQRAHTSARAQHTHTHTQRQTQTHTRALVRKHVRKHHSRM